MSIYVPGLKNIDRLLCGYFLRSLFAWIAAPRNLRFPKLNCACLRKAPLRQVNLGLTLTAYWEKTAECSAQMLRNTFASSSPSKLLNA